MLLIEFKNNTCFLEFCVRFWFFPRLLLFFREKRQFQDYKVRVQITFNSYTFIINKKLYVRIDYGCCFELHLTCLGGDTDKET